MITRSRISLANNALHSVSLYGISSPLFFHLQNWRSYGTIYMVWLQGVAVCGARSRFSLSLGCHKHKRGHSNFFG
ncbi:hypothetical protein [Spirulina sp. 06S082]|uniref:hypothetical protein n=1 Tax=Spirulina sp. 06S082 TaxID=3110248 RepID=UPI002B1FDAAB|nr:hypothetical protein [Spirulina sp. 06S082]MEA5470670.1 hypothetical protein [Spirulina sp. 06S082]